MCFLAFEAFALPVFALIYMAMNEKALICHAFLQKCLPKQWENAWQVSEMPYSAMLFDESALLTERILHGNE